MLAKSSPELIKSISDCCHNILIKNIPLTKGQHKKLQKHKNVIRAIGTKGLSISKKRKLLTQKGGFLSALLAPVIGTVASLVGDLVSSAVHRRK